MRNQKLKTWEIALALSLTITLSCGVTVPAYWWGVIFPQLSEPEYVYTETAAYPALSLAGEQSTEVRFRLLEWAQKLWAILSKNERALRGAAYDAAPAESGKR